MSALGLLRRRIELFFGSFMSISWRILRVGLSPTESTDLAGRDLDEQLEALILEEICRKPGASSREVAAATGTDHSLALIVLHKHGFKPFKIAKVQTPEQGDAQRRLAFCDWFIGGRTADPQFHSRILWSDESNFTNRGFFNRKNTLCWSTEPQVSSCEGRPQRRFGFNVWCGLLGSRIIGAWIHQGTLTGERYRNFIANELVDFLKVIPAPAGNHFHARWSSRAQRNPIAGIAQTHGPFWDPRNQ